MGHWDWVEGVARQGQEELAVKRAISHLMFPVVRRSSIQHRE